MSRKLNELALQDGGIYTLMRCYEYGNGGLGLERAQSLGDGLVVDGSKEESGVKLASLHVIDEGLLVGCARVADTVFPNRIEVVGNGGGKAGEIVVQVAIAV
jgi:hypothetical protein